VLHLLDVGSRRLLRSIQGDDDSANHALKTANLANETETFFEEDCREYCSDDNTESSKGGNKNSIDLDRKSSQQFPKEKRNKGRSHKGVGHKIAYLTGEVSALDTEMELVDHISPYDHQDHSSPPPSVLQVAVALASSLVVFLVRFEQSMLLQDE
jgi:hypothetical protein